MRFEEQIREQMRRNENNLTEIACRSCDSIKLHADSDDIRLQFERDADRIIHTLAYTRYIDKTQVYSDADNDNISKRMTHVQFVSRAARTIARALGLNEDLCEAIALGHDVGHTPFGHLGEAILDKLSTQKMGIGFAHNLNSVRMLMYIEKGGKGCNLSLQVLDGIMCHNGEMVKSEYAPINKTFEDFFYEYESCRKNRANIKKLIPMTMEGCVVRLSDIIGYVGKDIDDAVRLGQFDVSLIPKDIKDTLGANNEEIMNNIILDIIENSYGKNYIQMSPKVYNQVVALKKFNYENIYFKANNKQMVKIYTDMFIKLFDVYFEALSKNDKSNDIYTSFLNEMSDEYIKNNSKEQIIIDHLASMTDNYIERQYKKYVIN